MVWMVANVGVYVATSGVCDEEGRIVVDDDTAMGVARDGCVCVCMCVTVENADGVSQL